MTTFGHNIHPDTFDLYAACKCALLSHPRPALPGLPLHCGRVLQGQVRHQVYSPGGEEQEQEEKMGAGTQAAGGGAGAGA